MIARLVPFALTALLAPSSSARADVLFVGGPGADFIEIQDAVQAAADGDTIRIWPGSYATFTIDDKDLRIIGRSDVGDVETRLVRVNGLAAGKTVILHGLRVVDSGKDGLILSQNLGSVRVQHCELRGSHGDGSSGSAHPEGWIGARVLSSADVAFSDVVVRGGGGAFHNFPFNGGSGGTGMHVVDSSVALDRVTSTGGAGGSVLEYTEGYDGGHGLLVESSFVSMSGCAFTGGAGGSGGEDTILSVCEVGDGGAGGDGLQAAGSTILRRDTSATAGAGGAGGVSLFKSCHGSPGPAGDAVDTTTTTVTDLPGAARSLDAPTYVFENSTIELHVQGEIGDTLYLFRSTGAAFEPRPSGVWLVDLPWLSGPPAPFVLEPLPLGVIVGSGQLDASFAVGELPPGASERTLHLQVLARSTSGTVLRRALTGAATVVVLDDGLPEGDRWRLPD